MLLLLPLWRFQPNYFYVFPATVHTKWKFLKFLKLTFKIKQVNFNIVVNGEIKIADLLEMAYSRTQRRETWDSGGLVHYI